MTPQEAAGILAISATFDNRKADADAAQAWSMALEGLRFNDCREVVVRHYQTSRDWMMPSDVIGGVKRLRRERLDKFGHVTPPARFADDPAGEAAWMRDVQDRIGNGELTDPNELTEGKALYATRDVIAELGQVGRSVDSLRALVARPVRKPEPPPLVRPEDRLREPETTAHAETTTAEEIEHG